MKIILDDQQPEPFHTKVEIEGSASDIWGVGELIKQALLGMGYHPNTVRNLFYEEDESA
jgi:hypothetical protein